MSRNETRSCTQCGVTFTRGNRTATQWASAKYCSQRCNGASRERPLDERLWALVNVGAPDDCWEWQGGRHRFRYGRLGLGGERGRRTEYAHRISYILAHGPIPEGLYVCHHCDNPPCCNPDHLFLGTPSDNARDMSAKGRASAPSLKISDADVMVIRSRYTRRHHKRGWHWVSNADELAQEYGVTAWHISAIAHGRQRARLWISDRATGGAR